MLALVNAGYLGRFSGGIPFVILLSQLRTLEMLPDSTYIKLFFVTVTDE